MIINGEKMEFKGGIKVKELLQKLKLHENKVVVEVDREIIPRKNYEIKQLNTNSKVEIIQFVGGG